MSGDNLRSDRGREVVLVSAGEETTDGAGVKLRRLVGSRELNMLDPFMLFDGFGSKNTDDYIAGFPPHPHRGIETVTYMLEGSVEHGDSMGNSGVVGPGDVQWMTAGSGIIHSEMPRRGNAGGLAGFQLWVNLPESKKMCDPEYRDIPADRVPVVHPNGGTELRVISGEVDGIVGPLQGMANKPLFLDVRVGRKGFFQQRIPADHSVFAYVFAGGGEFGPQREKVVAPNIVVFGEGDRVDVFAGADGIRFLLIGASPLGEPVARGGPFVMNTREEIQQAFREYSEGTFVKKSA